MPLEDTTHFLAVSLDLRGRTDLRALVDALGPAVLLMNLQERFASVELAQGGEDLEGAVRAFVKCVEALAPEARRLWAACERRTLNVGLQAGLRPHALELGLTHEALSRLAALGADLALTLYGAEHAPARGTRG